MIGESYLEICIHILAFICLALPAVLIWIFIYQKIKSSIKSWFQKSLFLVASLVYFDLWFILWQEIGFDMDSRPGETIWFTAYTSVVFITYPGLYMVLGVGIWWLVRVIKKKLNPVGNIPS